MSILKLAEDLKDVPYHFLVSEVQQPTGSYPGYLVVAELERRKGMRDRYLKEAPKSTVVDDLSQPNREQMMAAVAQMQQQPMPQQQPLPPQMPPQMPLPPQIPQMPPAGLMATPQASSLAATDAVASPRKRMAGGGLVAFQEGGDVKRFQQGGGMPYDLLQTANQSNENLPPLSRAVQEMFGSNEIKKIDPETGEAISLGEYTRRQQAKQVAAGAKVIQMQKEAAQADLRGQITADHANVQNVILPKLKTARNSGSLGGSAASVPAAPQQQMPFPAVPTDEQLAAVGQKAISTFGQNVPQRFSETEKEIGRRAENLKDRRKSAQNEALMMAGLGILKSRSPGRWLGEGGEEGMLAYRQNMTNVRAGEDAMTDVRQNLAHQQLMQDLQQQHIGQLAQQRTLDMYRYGSDARYQQGQLANAQEQNRLAGLIVPSTIEKNVAEAGWYGNRLDEAPGVRIAKLNSQKANKYQHDTAVSIANSAAGYDIKNPKWIASYQEALRQIMGGGAAQPAQVPVRGEVDGARLVPQ